MTFEQNGLRFCSAVILTIFAVTGLGSCSRASSQNSAFVLSERVKLKSTTAQVSRVLTELKSGDKVEVLSELESEEGTRWVKVMIATGDVGWIEARNLVKESLVDDSRRLAEKVKHIQTQAVGRSRAPLRLRMSPSRSEDDNIAVMLPAGTLFEIIGIERRPRPIIAPATKQEPEMTGTLPETIPTSAPSALRYDEWYKVRIKDHRVLPAGWIYGGSISLEIPTEIIFFVSKGRRIAGWQKLLTVGKDTATPGDHYLVLERKMDNAGVDADFDRIRILAYDPEKRSYSIPFTENIEGKFPVTFSMNGQRGNFQFNSVENLGGLRILNYGIEITDKQKLLVIKPTKKN